MNSGFPFEHFVKNSNSNNLASQPAIPVPSNSSDLAGHLLDDFSTEELLALTNHILSDIKSSVSNGKFDAYFKGSLRLERIEGGKAYFLTPTPFIKSIIESNYINNLSTSILNVLGKKFEIVIQNEFVEQAQENSSKNEENQVFKSAKQVSFNLDFSPEPDDLKQSVDSRYLETMQASTGLTIDKRKSFDNFIVGISNNMAYASCVAVSKNPGGIYPSVYLYSRSGLGKTHLLHAVANNVNNLNPNLRICVTNAQHFLREMVGAVQQKKMDDFRRKYTDQLDVLMIDDIHELKQKQGLQDAFFHIFNDLYGKGKQLIFTSDKTPKEIDGIEDRIKTRLSWGLVIDIQQPDLETRIAILKEKALDQDIYIPDDVITLIASSIKDNIRELEGALVKLAAYGSMFRQDIDIEIAKRELKLDERTSNAELTIERISKGVSHYFKTPIADLKSKSRLKEIASSRHIAMYLSYKLLKTNLEEIGRFFGNRDHTTVLHGVNKMKKAIELNDPVSHKILEIENSLY